MDVCRPELALAGSFVVAILLFAPCTVNSNQRVKNGEQGYSFVVQTIRVVLREDYIQGL